MRDGPSKVRFAVYYFYKQYKIGTRRALESADLSFAPKESLNKIYVCTWSFGTLVKHLYFTLTI